MSETPNPLRLPNRYWKQLEQLKAASICIRLYRNRLARWVRWVEIVKAIGSSGGIAGWVIWRDWPFLWSGVIAASQFLDAMKGVFPFTQLHKAASDLTVALELICIDAEGEWESIYGGKIPIEGIIERIARLKKVQLEAERKHFPEGFEPSQSIIRLATQEAEAYFSAMYDEANSDD
ncbi:MAG: hypothetical protein M0002_14100 [Rhodospirillales bacterium]|nr:hypothetical protein [Rhodospirillales bacterium]